MSIILLTTSAWYWDLFNSILHHALRPQIVNADQSMSVTLPQLSPEC